MACALIMLAGCASGPDDRARSNVLSRADEEALNRQAGIEVAQAHGGIHMRLPEVVLFEFNQANLRPDADPVLSRSAALLNRSSKPISVEGHSDNIGSRERNAKLSTERAEVVGRAVIGRGVAASRISYQGHGFDRPVASNDTAAGRALNRRTEIFLKGETMDTLMGSTQ